MMKSVLIAIRPQCVEKIANGEKTIEVRKTAPKCEVPFKAYIYCTIGNGVKGDYLVPSGIQCGKVIGEFICDKVERLEEHIEQGGLYYILSDTFNEQAQLDNWELHDYGKGKTLYGLHISDLKIYNNPRELSEFRKPCDRFLDCCTCRRLVRNEYMSCDNKITRPPLSWCYVEDLGEEE